MVNSLVMVTGTIASFVGGFVVGGYFADRVLFQTFRNKRKTQLDSVASEVVANCAETILDGLFIMPLLFMTATAAGVVCAAGFAGIAARRS